MSYSLIKPVERRRDDAVFTGRLLLLPPRHDGVSELQYFTSFHTEIEVRRYRIRRY